MKNGRISTPYGVTLVKCAQMDSGAILGIDSTAAAELILGSDVTVDHDRLLSTQMNEISCSVLLGISKVTDGAAAVLEI